MARTAEEISSIVAEAIEIDKAIVAQLAAEDANLPSDPPAETDLIGLLASDIFPYGNTGVAATYEQAIAASERISRIVSSILNSSSTESDTISFSYLSRIADSHEKIEQDIDKLRMLADHPDGLGIRTTEKHSDISLALLYLLYVTQAQAIADPDASASDQAASLQKIQNLIQEVQTNFNGF